MHVCDVRTANDFAPSHQPHVPLPQKIDNRRQLKNYLQNYLLKNLILFIRFCLCNVHTFLFAVPKKIRMFFVFSLFASKCFSPIQLQNNINNASVQPFMNGVRQGAWTTPQWNERRYTIYLTCSHSSTNCRREQTGNSWPI